MTYRIYFSDGEVLTSEQIIEKLDRSIPLQAAWIAYVRDLEHRGCKYSNEDFDVLSGAHSAIRRTKTETWEQGFVDHWAPHNLAGVHP